MDRLSPTERYERCGQVLVSALEALPKTDKLYEMVVSSSFFGSIRANDPADPAWRSMCKETSLYLSRYKSLADRVKSAKQWRKTNDDGIEKLAENVSSAYGRMEQERRFQRCFQAMKARHPELGDEETKLRVQADLERQDILAREFSRRLEESSEEEIRKIIEENRVQLDKYRRRFSEEM